MGGTDCEKKVLRVIVENLVYPVTIDVLHTVRDNVVGKRFDEMMEQTSSSKTAAAQKYKY